MLRKMKILVWMIVQFPALLRLMWEADKESNAERKLGKIIRVVITREY